jgi:hypothetical protein
LICSSHGQWGGGRSMLRIDCWEHRCLLQAPWLFLVVVVVVVVWWWWLPGGCVPTALTPLRAACCSGSGESGMGIYDGYITNIHISDERVDGPPPRELGVFSHLREFDMDGGHISGPFPEWMPRSFPQLAELDMRWVRACVLLLQAGPLSATYSNQTACMAHWRECLPLPSMVRSSSSG